MAENRKNPESTEDFEWGLLIDNDDMPRDSRLDEPFPPDVQKEIDKEVDAIFRDFGIPRKKKKRT